MQDELVGHQKAIPWDQKPHRCNSLGEHNKHIFAICAEPPAESTVTVFGFDEPGLWPGTLRVWKKKSAKDPTVGNVLGGVLGAGLGVLPSGDLVAVLPPAGADPRVAKEPLRVAVVQPESLFPLATLTLVVPTNDHDDVSCLRAGVKIVSSDLGGVHVAELQACIDYDKQWIRVVAHDVSGSSSSMRSFNTEPVWYQGISFSQMLLSAYNGGDHHGIWFYTLPEVWGTPMLRRALIPFDTSKSLSLAMVTGFEHSGTSVWPRLQLASDGRRAIVRELHDVDGVTIWTLLDDLGRAELRVIQDSKLWGTFGLDQQLDFWARGFAAVTREPGVRLFDSWAHATCEESGVCAALTYEDCDDNDPCTKNLCEPDVGCVNPLWEDGVTCGEGKTCQAGLCVEG